MWTESFLYSKIFRNTREIKEWSVGNFLVKLSLPCLLAPRVPRTPGHCSRLVLSRPCLLPPAIISSNLMKTKTKALGERVCVSHECFDIGFLFQTTCSVIGEYVYQAFFYISSDRGSTFITVYSS